jgi:hypothetical protein
MPKPTQCVTKHVMTGMTQHVLRTMSHDMVTCNECIQLEMLQDMLIAK